MGGQERSQCDSQSLGGGDSQSLLLEDPSENEDINVHSPKTTLKKRSQERSQSDSQRSLGGGDTQSLLDDVVMEDPSENEDITVPPPPSMTTKTKQSVISSFFTKTPSKTKSRRSDVFEEENENVDDPEELVDEVNERETQSDGEESETTSLNETVRDTDEIE